eukprot:symbB.v1.2.031354.t1/scaffold3632.1/size52985/4
MPAETDKATAKELQRIRRLPENRVCPNCLKEENVGFGAVCTTFKTFICHDCKSAHQSFSHRCKSVQMSIWTMDEVKALDEGNGGGNAAAIRYFLSRLTEKERVKQGASPDAYKRFIERAYIKLRWAEEKAGKDDAKEEKVEKEVSLPKLESAADDFTELPKEPKTKRKSRKSRRAAEGNGDSHHGQPETMQQVSWHPGVETFYNQADVGYGSWMAYDASPYPYADSGENGWAWQNSGPNASYPSGPSYYPGQGTRKACTLSMEATLLSAQALRMKRQGSTPPNWVVLHFQAEIWQHAGRICQEALMHHAMRSCKLVRLQCRQHPLHFQLLRHGRLLGQAQL